MSVVSSDSLGYTKASRRWFDKYWKPINCFGYRDIEHDLDSLDGKKVLFVVGDSFAAGHGTKNHRDRFSDVLWAQLGDDWEVFNIARNGWSTQEELAAIRDFPVRPDVVVLSYFVNDINGAARRAGQRRPPMFARPHWLIRPIVEHSNLFNFFYWRVYRFQNAWQLQSVYFAHLEKIFNDDKTWSLHEQELHQFVDWAENNEVRMVTVLFPILLDVDFSKPFAQKVGHLLRARGIPAIDLSEILSGRNPQELVVNKFDAHPSVSLHSEVASLIHAQLVE